MSDDVVNVRYETRKSNKNNSYYDVLVLTYKGYEKLVFLDNAEKYIFKDLKK